MMKTRRLALAALSAVSLAMTGCKTSFEQATTANTDRIKYYQDSLLIQAENDLTAVHDCFLRSAGYARVQGTSRAIHKIGEPTSDAHGCTVMAMGLRTQANMLMAFSPFISQVMQGRVPASPEEIASDLFKFGVKASLMKFGIEKTADVILSGQAANAQIAQAGIEAASKPPLVVDKPYVVQVPMGSAPLPAAATTNTTATP